MAEVELQKAYDFILEMLRENELNWVASQIQEKVRGGKLVEKRAEFEAYVLPDLSPEFSSQRARTSRKQLFTTTEDYTERERVEIALDAIEATVLQTSAIRDEVLILLGERNTPAEDVQFLPDEYDESSQSSLSAFQARNTESRIQLKSTLDNIRGEITSND